jgi:hypothetical protein
MNSRGKSLREGKPITGEPKSTSVLLDTRAFSYYDVTQPRRNAATGGFAILAGGSSVDIRHQGKYSLAPGQENH